MTRWLNGNRNPDKDDQPHVNFLSIRARRTARERTRPTVLAAVKAARRSAIFWW